MSEEKIKYPLVDAVGQSAPLKFPAAYEDLWIGGKTILITGGASGFGEAFVRRWAKAGACIVFGDINVPKAQALVREVRSQAGHENVHFVPCDVTDWTDQVHLFKEAIKLSPSRGIDHVIVNAGIADNKVQFENPVNLDAEDPRPPNLKVIKVSLIGAMYTTHLALFYLSRNPDSSPASAKSHPAQPKRDRHILLIGSAASILPIPAQALYGAAKHGLLGMYRSLRATSFTHGIRTNLICPYFVNTALLNATTRGVLLAGAGLGSVEDVVEAATMFVADSSIVGRAVVVGPKLRVSQDDSGLLTLSKESQNDERGIWEIYAHDFEDSDVFSRNIVGLLNRAMEIKGWVGWAADVIGAVGYGFSTWWNGTNKRTYKKSAANTR